MLRNRRRPRYAAVRRSSASTTPSQTRSLPRAPGEVVGIAWGRSGRAAPSRGTHALEQASLGQIENGLSAFAGSPGEIVEEDLQSVAGLQMLEEAANRDSRALEDR